jgi:hypothetical protein
MMSGNHSAHCLAHKKFLLLPHVRFKKEIQWFFFLIGYHMGSNIVARSSAA